MENSDELEISIKDKRYPYCIVWTPLPLITQLLPFIGHTGICTSEGIIHDFAGPYTISIDNMAFGSPTRYFQLEVPNKSEWDEAICKADAKYKETMHNLLFNNCHDHVACAMNLINYQKKKWNMFNIAWLMFTQGHSTGLLSTIKTYIGFIILLISIWLYY
jgi:transmembrane protein 222